MAANLRYIGNPSECCEVYPPVRTGRLSVAPPARATDTEVSADTGVVDYGMAFSPIADSALSAPDVESALTAK